MSMGSTDKGLLTPANCAVALLDFQPIFLAALSRADRRCLLASLSVLVRSAQIFELPVIVTTVSAPFCDAAPLPEIVDAFPQLRSIVRSSMNAWDDATFVTAVAATGRRNFVLAALLSEISLVCPALQMLEDGYGIYTVEDASRATNRPARRAALRRIGKAGGISVTALQFLLELQRDWAIVRHRDEVLALLETYYGSVAAGAERAERPP